MTERQSEPRQPGWYPAGDGVLLGLGGVVTGLVGWASWRGRRRSC